MTPRHLPKIDRSPLGMVLAAGLGQRMRPLTDLIPKPALPVAGRPLVHLAIENLRRAGTFEVHVNAWYLPDRLFEVIETVGGTGFNVITHRERDLLGTAGGLRGALGADPGSDVLVHNGDVLYRGSLEELVRVHRERGALATLGLVRVADRATPRSVILAPGGNVDAFRRESIPPPNAWTFSGIHVLASELFHRIPERGCIVADVYAGLLDTRRIAGVPLPGFWADVGTVGRYKALYGRLIRDVEMLGSIRPDLAELRTPEGVVVHPTARVDPSARLEPPVIVDAAAEVRADAVVGPEVYVGAGALIRKGVRVARTVVFPGAAACDDLNDVFLVDDAVIAAFPPST